MGIELPAELADVARRTGTRWPEADEEAMAEQARAWRQAASDVEAVAGDADVSASGALGAMEGDAGDAARSVWSGFVGADSGKLTTAAQNALQAADRLEHAAGQIADGKVEIVRQLVDAARNADAAQTAADAGHPQALLGLPSLFGAVSANVTSVTDSLVGAVGDTARELDPSGVVGANPGSPSGRAGLVEAVTGLGPDIADAAADHGRGAVDRVTGTVDPGEVTGRGAGAVSDVLDGVGAAADEAPGQVSAAAGDLGRGGDVVDDARAAGDAARDTVEPVRGEARGDQAHGVSPEAPTPLSGVPVAGSPGGSFAEAVTPRSGIPLAPGAGSVPSGGQPPVADPSYGRTSLAGFADAPIQAPQAPPAAGPPLPGAAGAPGAPGGIGAAPFGGQYGGPVAGGGPAGGAAPGGAAPGAGAPGAGAGQAAQGRGSDRAPMRSGGGVDAGGQQAVPRQEPRQQAQPAAFGTPRQERESVVALFLVHMFPIGHLPVASDRPARQLPSPPVETDYAAGLRFEPHDHPESGAIDTGNALVALGAGLPPVAETKGLPADAPAVATLAEGYDPLAEADERDWDRRYLVKSDDAASEYAWPPCELYPEGGLEDGVPVTLEAGRVIDRFGTEHGRVFAAEQTPFGKRSLPPTHLDAGYRRYRVLRELPVWRAVSAGWFGQLGGGIRYRAVYPARDLVALGYLEPVTETGNDDAAGERA